METSQIPVSELIIGSWYVGRGRNGNIGLWEGDHFLVIGQCGTPVSWEPRKWITKPCIKLEPYFTEEGGCFQPFLLVNEGVVHQKMDNDSYPYAKTLMFS